MELEILFTRGTHPNSPVYVTWLLGPAPGVGSRKFAFPFSRMGCAKPQSHQISVMENLARSSVYLGLPSDYTGLHNVRQPFLPMCIFATNPHTCVPQPQFLRAASFSVLPGKSFTSYLSSCRSCWMCLKTQPRAFCFMIEQKGSKVDGYETPGCGSTITTE
jgi:hypothetical protein